MARYADVVLPLPLGEAYTYALPEPLQQKVRAGCRLIVQFGQRKVYAAVVVALRDDCPEAGFTIKEALALLDDSPVLLPEQLSLWRWIADYYLCSIGEVCKAALPSGMKLESESVLILNAEGDTSQSLSEGEAEVLALLRKRKTLKVAELQRRFSLKGVLPLVKALLDKGLAFVREEVKDTRRPKARLAESDGIPSEPLLLPLSEAQQQVKAEIESVFKDKSVCLLHGVTGSGKTEVYIHLISDTLRQGGQVLYLLPEIVLTAQLVERLRRVFGTRLGVYHSKYSDRERVELWKKQLSPEPYDVIVGVRSSVFLPFQRLRLLIVDEEHETSFKQQEPAPRYHARDTALVLAQMYGAKALLGTATPSLESYRNAREGKYGLVRLTERYGHVEMPEIVAVNTAELRRRKEMRGQFSPTLLNAMRNALDKGEQVILFRNRRGFAPSLECHVCGWTPRCLRCDVPLTLHREGQRMVCHYCGSTYPVPTQCPNCSSQQLVRLGYGTERIEEEIQTLFPEARVARMDQDTTRTRRAYESLLRDFEQGKTDILVGTQMVAKGLDIERVSVVGILGADTMLAFPDFRAAERAFQMMAQVSGRAGRRSKKGLVILQAKDTGQSVIGQVLRGDYEAMYLEQMEEREAFAYPPVGRLVYVFMKHKERGVADLLAAEMASLLRADFADRVLGPDTPPVGMVRLYHIRKIVLKLERSLPMPAVRRRLRQLQAHVLAQPQYRSAQFYYDVDPY
ncbi:MAG: primosomal protein N' [Prevotellaceae bacterium]|nr:primosomal protein N' [Prevotellaceae bacterium]